MREEKIERNLEIVRLRDEDGRLFTWIAEQFHIAEKTARRIYHREKAKRALKKHGRSN